jgi:rod shape-determining protein MreD
MVTMGRNGSAMRRRPSPWRRLDAASRFAFPVGTLIFGLFIIGLPFGLPGQAELRPVFAMACVFFWSLYRPSSLPAPVTALTGLLLDVMGLSPLGLWAVLLLILQGATLASRRRLIPRGFFLTWAVFSGLAACLCVLAWVAAPRGPGADRKSDGLRPVPGPRRLFHPCPSRPGGGGIGVNG